MSRDAGTAAGQRAVNELGAMQTYKKQKNCYQLCLFLFSNNVDLKNNFRNYRKTILKFLDARIAAINLFQFDLDKP